MKHCACEHCGSSDGNSLYDDGEGKSHYFCHVCHTWTNGDENIIEVKPKERVSIN